MSGHAIDSHDDECVEAYTVTTVEPAPCPAPFAAGTRLRHRATGKVVKIVRTFAGYHGTGGKLVLETGDDIPDITMDGYSVYRDPADVEGRALALTNPAEYLRRHCITVDQSTEWEVVS